MKNKQILLSVFVFFIFNLFALNPFSKSNPTPYRGPGLYGQDVDLVKLKEEEEERKKKTKKSKYVVTNDNLGKIETPNKPHGVTKLGGKEAEKDAATVGGNTGNQSETVIGNNSPSGSRADDYGTVDRQSKTYWQDRASKLYNAIEKTQADIKRSQLELNRLFNVALGAYNISPPTHLLNRMDSLKKHIREAKQKLADLNKAIEDMEDQARKESIPAGWLRVDRPEPEKKQEEGQSDI